MQGIYLNLTEEYYKETLNQNQPVWKEIIVMNTYLLVVSTKLFAKLRLMNSHLIIKQCL